MKLAYRLAYFSGGFLIGIALLFFILSGKKTSCAYGPESRTLKNIRLKDRAFSESTLQILRENKMDTSAVSTLLEDGDEFSEKNLKITVENCEKLATVIEAEVLEQ